LKGVQVISIKPGESKRVTFSIRPEMLELINEEGDPILEKGDFTLTLSGSLPTKRALALGAPAPVQTTLSLK
jgi:beta-glucosidase